MADIALMHHLLIALGIGLLIGAERERRKAERPASAGLRSFTIAGLVGCGSALTPWVWMSGVVLACITALALFSNWQRRTSCDPGITTEIALIATTLLGALSVSAPDLAGASAVLITIVLAAREPLHRFVGQMVTAEEVADVLLIAGATLIVLPMLPDRPMGPFAALNPHAIWLVVIMILGINAMGQLATRLLGARLGVPMLGLVSGFISSSATIGAMGAWVRANPASLSAGVAAAVLSTVANYVQMAVVIEVTDHNAFLATAATVAAAASAAALSGGWFMLAAWRETSAEPPRFSRSFNVMIALVFAAMLAGMLILVAAMQAWFGTMGIAAAAAIGGVLDVHAAVISIATLVSERAITPAQAIVPVLIACTTSSLAKMLFSATAGTRAFAARVIPAQAGIVIASWMAGLATLRVL
ncbi:MgtC/SapB family protein [Novosphingobium capsulatum]|jgi:uncharacterized membrane protein (DUF4010 family)|uniref:MgtC/SapB family protein n=1 Tax=Novosphingobium capsulatum TaxID=13688 RepID=UPI000A66C1D5|nr:DUF4010 domain-containing protein [Novosphingobium capsulatum]WQD94691.1 DUF4010 domain-containing protein [Novosphingobium capsulatum]